MNVTAVLVTRGDVPLAPIVATFPPKWEVLVWNNGEGTLAHRAGGAEFWDLLKNELPDLAVYGRYAALEHASNEIIYVQDDDCLVDNPAAIARACPVSGVACNMPHEFRHAFYTHHALVGFGASFRRRIVAPIFAEFHARYELGADLFNRTCDIVFTGLTERGFVDVPVQSLSYASDPNRMWKQPEHQQERSYVLALVQPLAFDVQRALWEVPGG